MEITTDTKEFRIAVSEAKQLYSHFSRSASHNSNINYCFTGPDCAQVIADVYITYGMIKLGDDKETAINLFVEKVIKITGDTSYNWRDYFYCLVGMIS